MNSREISLKTPWHGNLTAYDIENVIKGEFARLADMDVSLQREINALSISQLEENPTLLCGSSHVMITFHRSKGIDMATHEVTDGDNSLLAVPWWEWKNHEMIGNVADGVLIIPDAGEPLIVAPTGSDSFKWSWQPGIGDKKKYTDIHSAFRDMDGESNTALILDPTDKNAYGLFGENEEQWRNYAAGYCGEYEFGSLGKGQWWLPSLGELNLIRKYLYEINLALSIIAGGKEITMGNHWTSTEAAISSAWSFNPYTGFTHGGYKCTPQTDYYVRPVTALDLSQISYAE